MAKPEKTPLIKQDVAEAMTEKPKSVWDKLDVPIEHSGRAITLPAEPGPMPLTKAIEALQRKQADEEQEYQVHELFDAYPHDAAVAFVRAMQELYGFASFQSKEIETFFGKVKRPPTMLSVKIGFRDEDVVQCPLGQMRLPGVSDPIECGIYGESGFVVHGTIRKRDRHVILELATKTRELLRSQSIYRGKPIRLGVDEDGNLDTSNPPTFMDVTDISEGDVLFDADIRSQIDTNILVPIRETARCRAHRIPLKRGVLLEGQYGTGKSLTAKLTARVCEKNGWTFVLLDKVQGLRTALEFANRYAPAVVFAEDIDRVAEIRDEKANDLVNTIDGVVSKRAEIMTVLTTNFVEKLNPVILRPGRLDAVITLRAPNAETVQKLLRYYAAGLLPDSEQLGSVGKELEGQIPASIRECVERAKLGMIGRNAETLAEIDLLTAAKTMKNHLSLLNKKVAEETPAEALARSLHKVVHNGGAAKLDEMHTKVREIHEHVT
jgi:hypothetical protein